MYILQCSILALQCHIFSMHAPSLLCVSLDNCTYILYTSYCSCVINVYSIDLYEIYGREMHYQGLFVIINCTSFQILKHINKHYRQVLPLLCISMQLTAHICGLQWYCISLLEATHKNIERCICCKHTCIKGRHFWKICEGTRYDEGEVL